MRTTPRPYFYTGAATAGLVLRLLLLLRAAGTAYRVQLTDSALPFLATDTGAVVRWSSGETLSALYYRARWIEIAPRGLRMGTAPLLLSLAPSVQAPCAPVPNALCGFPGSATPLASGTTTSKPSASAASSTTSATASAFPFGAPLFYEEAKKTLFLPSWSWIDSAGTNATTVFPVVDPYVAWRRAEPGNIPLWYAAQDACALNGVGRVFASLASSAESEASEGASYTVTACDVMQGHLVAVYDTTDGTLHLLTQSFGPMAYFGVIVQSVLCLYYATASSTSLTNAPALVALWLQASCALLLVTQGVPFLTAADAMHAVLWLAVGVALALHSWLAHAEDEGTEACLYALGSLATLMYRTPEHAYAGVLCAVLVVRQWEKLLLVKKRKSPLFNLFLTTVALATLADTGVAPQCTPPERWPFYAGLGVYMGFALALLRSSTEPT